MREGMTKRMFGTNGVRGVADEDMSCELALGMGRSVAAVLGKRIAVARDPRTSSPMLRDALCAGLMSAGADVVDLGMVPTPALQHWIRVRGDLDGGVMITASHNPPEFNGIKCIAGDGTECTKEQEDGIEAAYRRGVDTVAWDSIGTVEHTDRAADEYVDSVVSEVDADAIRSARLKVVLDCANGCSCPTSPRLMERLGVETVVINGTPDMRHPGHLSEPTADNLRELMERVRSEHADLGIAHDGDADRCVFVTSDGTYVPGDLALAVLGRYLLGRNGGGKVVVTVATSRVVEDAAAEAGGETVYTAVGSPIVAREMAADGALFGGEENGGLIFASHQYCRDGAMGAAVMLECIAKEGALSEQLKTLPEYTTVKVAVKCPEDFKEKVTDAIASVHPDLRTDRTDGLKFIYDDGWVLMRPSGTEPKYRIYSESSDPATAERRSKEFCEEFAAVLEQLRSAVQDRLQLGLHLHDGPDLGGIYPAHLGHVHGDVIPQDDGAKHVLQVRPPAQTDPYDLRRACLHGLHHGFEIARVMSDEEQDDEVRPIRPGPGGHPMPSELGSVLAECHELRILIHLCLPAERDRLHSGTGAYHGDMPHETGGYPPGKTSGPQGDLVAVRLDRRYERGDAGRQIRTLGRMDDCQRVADHVPYGVPRLHPLRQGDYEVAGLRCAVCEHTAGCYRHHRASAILGLPVHFQGLGSVAGVAGDHGECAVVHPGRQVRVLHQPDRDPGLRHATVSREIPADRGTADTAQEYLVTFEPASHPEGEGPLQVVHETA